MLCALLTILAACISCINAGRALSVATSFSDNCLITVCCSPLSGALLRYCPLWAACQFPAVTIHGSIHPRIRRPRRSFRLQDEGLNLRNLQRVNNICCVQPTRCDREATPGSNGKEFLLKCERTLKSAAVLYFNQKAGLWEVSMHGVGSPHVNIVVASRTSLPTLAKTGSWNVADHNGGWQKAPMIVATCKKSEQSEFTRYHIPQKVPRFCLTVCSY